MFFSRIAPLECIGNCNGDDRVAISELIFLVNVGLDKADIAACKAGDTASDGRITISELIAAVKAALRGCENVADNLSPTSAPS